MERLGRRLIEHGQPDPADMVDLRTVLGAYEPVLTGAVEIVSHEMGVTPSARIKNAGTIIEKLHRNGGHTLSTMQDLAGMRLVLEGGRAKQDESVQRLSDIFAACLRKPRVLDRRAEPTQGYRAVHVVVFPDGYPIEIQVRTYWQHVWAEQFERMADLYGRGIRYGEPPIRGGADAVGTVQRLIKMSDLIAEAETSSGLGH